MHRFRGKYMLDQAFNLVFTVKAEKIVSRFFIGFNHINMFKLNLTFSSVLTVQSARACSSCIAASISSKLLGYELKTLNTNSYNRL